MTLYPTNQELDTLLSNASDEKLREIVRKRGILGGSRKDHILTLRMSISLAELKKLSEITSESL